MGSVLNVMMLLFGLLKYIPDIITLVKSAETLLTEFHNAAQIVVTAKKTGVPIKPAVVAVAKTSTGTVTVPISAPIENGYVADATMKRINQTIESSDFKRITEGQ